MKNRICYKIVYIGNGILQSYTAGEYYNPTVYYVNEMVYAPKGTKLFVFDTLENAAKYLCASIDTLQYWVRYKVYKCEAYNVYRPKNIGHWSLKYDQEMFWKCRNNKKTTKTWSRPAPKGTLFADSIKLLKKLN